MKEKLQELRKLVEELTPGNIFDLYGGWWVTQQPTHPHSNIRQSLMDEVESRWYKVKRKVQGDLLAEGALASLKESRHILRSLELSTDNEKILQLFETNGIEFVGPSIYERSMEELDRMKGREFDEDFSTVKKTYLNIAEMIQSLPERVAMEFSGPQYQLQEAIRLAKEERGREEGVAGVRDALTDVEVMLDEEREYLTGAEYRKRWYDMVKDIMSKVDVRTWPETRDRINGVLAQNNHLNALALKETMQFLANDLFALDGWDVKFGGDSWARIASSISKLWDEYPTADFRFIDHVIDLAHNTNTWLDKFEEGDSLLSALDKKFNARTPKEYVDEMTDRKIIAGVKRIRL